METMKTLRVTDLQEEEPVYKIKVTGSGTAMEIHKKMLLLAQDIKNGHFNDGNYEDEILFAEIREEEES
jgi:hypothetical protein